jgi:cell wall-associated NlpC family hydrolase
VTDHIGAFLGTADGLFAPLRHLRAIGDWESDAASVAERFLGTPYLWGGNSRSGIDCSGLVQAALLACGRACPGDSDLQHAAVGSPVADGERVRRGDLYFWRGHVAMALDHTHLIHANAHYMAVTIESAREVRRRIEADAGTAFLGIRRP